MDEIIPLLWMGNGKSLPTVDAIVDCQYQDATRLASIAPLVNFPALPPKPFLWLPFIDSTPGPTGGDMPPEAYLSAAMAFIEGMRGIGRSVLVQCFSGKNRSGLVIGAYLIHHRFMPAEEAIALIRSKRGPDALSNPTFVAALEAMACST